MNLKFKQWLGILNVVMRNRGFSLIEVAIAIGVLALVFSGMLAVFDRGAIAARKTQSQAIAYNLLREKLEELSNINPGLFVPNSTCSRPSPLSCPPRQLCPCSSYTPPDEAIAPVAAFANFEREVDITLLSPGLVRIQAVVWWDNGRYSQNIETLKANY